MSRAKNSNLFKALSLILISTFLSLDISYAYPPEHNANDSTLAIPSVLQQTPINEQAAQLQQTVLSQGKLLGAVCSIGKYLLEDKLPIKYLRQVISAELGKAIEDIDLSQVTVKDGAAFIPCVINNRKRIVQLALKNSLAVKNLTGDEWAASERYTIKIAPEKKEQSNRTIEPHSPKNIDEQNIGLFQSTLIKRIVQEFDLGEILNIDFINGGGGRISSPIPRIKTAKGVFLIKKLKRMRADQKGGEEDASFIMDYVHYLIHQGISIPSVTKNDSNGNDPRDYFTTFDVTTPGDKNKRYEFYTVDKFVEGRSILREDCPPETLKAIGKTLGKIHKVSENFPIRFKLGPGHYSFLYSVNGTLDPKATWYDNLDSYLNPTEKNIISEAMKEIRNYWSEHDINKISKPQTIPSDMNMANIIFNESGTEIRAIFDWDNARPNSYRIEDFFATLCHGGRPRTAKSYGIAEDLQYLLQGWEEGYGGKLGKNEEDSIPHLFVTIVMDHIHDSAEILAKKDPNDKYTEDNLHNILVPALASLIKGMIDKKNTQQYTREGIKLWYEQSRKTEKPIKDSTFNLTLTTLFGVEYKPGSDARENAEYVVSVMNKYPDRMDGFIKDLFEALDRGGHSATWSGRYAPLALAMHNILKGGNVNLYDVDESFNKLSKDIPEIAYLLSAYPLTARDRAGLPPSPEFKFNGNVLASTPIKIIDFGSAPKEDGPPVFTTLLSVLELLHPGRFDAVITDIVYPKYRITDTDDIEPGRYQFVDGKADITVKKYGADCKITCFDALADGTDGKYNVVSDSYNSSEKYDFVIASNLVAGYMGPKYQGQTGRGIEVNGKRLLREDGNDQKYDLNDDQERIIKNLLKSLKPNGILFFNPSGTAIDRSTDHVFQVIQNKDGSYVVFDNVIPYTTSPECLMTPFNNLADYLPKEKRHLIEEILPKDKASSDEIKKLFTHAFSLAYHYQNNGHSIWANMSKASCAIGMGRGFIKVFNTIMEYVPDKYRNPVMDQVKDILHKEHVSIIDDTVNPEQILDHYTSLTDKKLKEEAVCTRDHMERVGGIVSRIGVKIGLSPDDMKILMAAAYGHDAGTDMLSSVWKNINDAKVDTNLEKTRANIKRNPGKANTLLSLPDFIVYAEKLITERKGVPLTDEEKYLIELMIEDDYRHGENSVEFLSNFYIIPEEVAILIREHKDYESFLENIGNIKDSDRMERLLSILITADAFEAINARTSKAFKETFDDIRKKGLNEEPLNALLALLEKKDKELLDIIFEARKTDKLTPEDEVFLKLSGEKEFKKIFSSYPTIKEAEANGWLGIAIPRWKELKIMQQWGPHDDTVAAHTLGVLEALSQNEALRNLKNPEDAFTMAFFHDFGKDFYNPNYKKSSDQKHSDTHNIISAKLVLDILPGFGFSEEYAKKIAWYVKYHHVMWHLAYKGGIEANITDANGKETTSSFLDELTERDIDIFTMFFCAEMKQVGTWDLGSNSESILKVSDQLKRFVNETKDIQGKDRKQKIAQFMKELINAASERKPWVEKSIRFISPSVMEYPNPDQIEEVFRSLDEEIVNHGIFGIIPTYRYNYIKLLMDNMSLIDESKYLSAACKNDLRKLSAEDRKSFAIVANRVLLDILNRSSNGEEGYSLPVVSNLDYMPNSPTILLVAPFEKKELKAGSFLAPPLGIYRLANYLRLFGIKVDIFDPNLNGGKEKGAEELCDFVKKQTTNGGYDFIGFSIYAPTLENDLELAGELKKISAKSIFIAGGEGAFYNSEKLLTPDTSFNAIYKGFGEASLLDTLILYMQNGKGNLYDKEGAREIKSAIVKLKTGEVIETPPQSMVTKDEYRVMSLFFDSTIVPYEGYWSFMEELYVCGSAEVKPIIDVDAIKTVRLITSSHCPMGCSFCSSTNFLNDSIGEKRQRVLSLAPQEIIEILRNIKKYHPETRTIFFNDDDFMIYPKRVKELCGLIKKEFGGNGFRFIALGRVDKVDKELLEKMQEAGFIQINYGIESFSDKVLLDMNKNIKSSKNITGLDITLNSGIVPLINLILFYPTATKEDVLSTMRTSVEFVAKGAELSYWPFVEAFKGASIMKKVKNGKNPEGEYELSENGKDISPVDIEVRNLAKEAIRNKETVIQEIKTKYAIKGKIPHVVDVLAFFIAFYRASGEPTQRIEQVINDRLGAHAQKIKTIEVGKTSLNVIVAERINTGLIEFQKPIIVTTGEEGEAERRADKELRAGHVGVITVAGGEASRAGIGYPKGMHPIMPVSDKTLFETRAEEIKVAEEYYGKTIPWYIMISENTGKATQSYFGENKFFGLRKEDVIFVQAESVPAFLAGTQRVAMKDAEHILTMPGGHGNIYKAMQNKQARTDGGKISALEDAKQRGIETFVYCQIDNAMPVMNRRALGVHLKENSDFTIVSVRKRDQEENLGIPVLDTLNGNNFFVEYNQPGGEELKHKKGFDYGACGIFILARSFMEKMDQPPYHLVRNKKSKIYKDGKIQQGLIDKYENFMFDVLPYAKKSVNILFPREECFAPFKSMEGPDSYEAAAKTVSNYWKIIIGRAFPELEIPQTTIIELPRRSEYMKPRELRRALLAINFPNFLEGNASLLVSSDFMKVTKKILNLSGNSRALSGRLLTGKLSRYEREILKRAILEKYREEQKVGAIEKIRYPQDSSDWESAGNALAKAREKYAETGKPLFLEGVTLIYRPRDNKYGLFREAIEKMNNWNTAEEKPLVATVAAGSEHITLYDLACMLDWERKYKNQFNDSTKHEIDKRTEELLGAGGFETGDHACEQATYEILTKKVDKILKDFKADRAPVFKPCNIAISMPPCGPFAVLLSMEPKTAEDLAIVTKIQDAIRDETGIENTGAVKVHITLGYIVNSIYKDEKVFGEFMRHITELDAYIRGKGALPEHEFTSPQMELSYLDNLDNYKPISTFGWIGSNINSATSSVAAPVAIRAGTPEGRYDVATAKVINGELQDYKGIDNGMQAALSTLLERITNKDIETKVAELLGDDVARIKLLEGKTIRIVQDNDRLMHFTEDPNVITIDIDALKYNELLFMEFIHELLHAKLAAMPTRAGPIEEEITVTTLEVELFLTFPQDIQNKILETLKADNDLDDQQFYKILEKAKTNADINSVRDDIINYVLSNLPDHGIGIPIAVSYDTGEYLAHVAFQQEYSDTATYDGKDRQFLHRTPDGKIKTGPCTDFLLTKRKPINEYIKEFKAAHSELEIIAVLPHGNAMTNEGFVIFSGGKLYHTIKEIEQPDAKGKTYTCFVSWKDKWEGKKYSVKELEFRGNEVFVSGTASPITDKINYAVSGQQLVKGSEAVPIASLYDKLVDPKQIFIYPHFKYKDSEGNDRDLFFGMAAMYKNKELFEKVLKPEPEFIEFSRAELVDLGINANDVIKTAMDELGYKEEADYILTPSMIKIRLKLNPYAHNLIGVNDKGDIVTITCTGDSKKHKGITITDLQDFVIKNGVKDMIMLSNGTDIQILDGNGKRLVESANKARTEMPAVIIIAKKRLSVSKTVEFSLNNENNLNQFEADSAVGDLIILARRAQRENQKLIIGLETDWIPGMNVKGSLQRNAIAALMKEIDGIGETLKSMGLDNVEVIRGSGNDLANTLLTEADKTHTSLHNIVVMASTNTINSNSFTALKDANENDRPFLAGIDPTELMKLYDEFGETTSKQLYIRLMQMLYMTLELASGKEPPQIPLIMSYDKKTRTVIFLPKAEPRDYEMLKNVYAAEKMALAAA
ncbi:MAG: UTP--glucose-1-phosphate uridylyltransferase [Candidatus Omnitrophica bacterium]|nr:UTP--glucose-1-phosphate uridylyltransferase [Candidatus Omnitrophota bacterium]